MSITIPGFKNVSNYAPFRRYTRYKHQGYVEETLIALLKLGKITDLETEKRMYIPTNFCKKQIFIDAVIKKNNKIAFIEVDGPQHYKYVPDFHKNGMSDFIKQQNRDRIVNTFCKNNNIAILRLPTTLDEDKIYRKLINFINSL